MSNDCHGFSSSTKNSYDDVRRLVNDNNNNDIDDLKNYVLVNYPSYSDKEEDNHIVNVDDDVTELATEEDMNNVKKVDYFVDVDIVNKSSASNQQKEENLKLILKLLVIFATCTLIVSLSIILTYFGIGAKVINDIGKSTVSLISFDNNINGELQKVYTDIENEKQKQNELINELSSMYNTNKIKKKTHASADHKMMKVNHIQQKYGATHTKSSSSSDSRLKEMKKIVKVHPVAHDDDHRSTHRKNDRPKYIHNHRYVDNYHGTMRQGKQQQMKPSVKKSTGTRSGSIDNAHNKNGKLDEINTEILASRELLPTKDGEYSHVTYDNFESFLDKQTQPAGSINRVVLVFYESTNAQSLSNIVEQVATLSKMDSTSTISIGLIDCSTNQLLCNNNSIQSYPTLRVYQQRKPKLNSSGKKMKYLRYVYTTVATIDEIINEISIANNKKEIIKQYPTMMMQQQQRINRGSGGLVSEKRRLHQLKTKHIYPQVETHAAQERKHDTDVVTAELDNGLNVHDIVVINYKNFYNFFIGETKVNKNRILMVFYKPTDDFINSIAPILNQIAANNDHHVGVVNCNLYETICRNHSITNFQTMRWYSTHDDDDDDAMNNDTTTQGNKEQKALWYESTTHDELVELLLLEERNKDSQSPMI